MNQSRKSKKVSTLPPKLNSCHGKNWSGETIQGRKLFAEILYFDWRKLASNLNTFEVQTQIYSVGINVLEP